jgi:hypothetical protein
MSDENQKRTISKKTLLIALGIVLALAAAGAAWAVLGGDGTESVSEGESISTADATGSVDAQSGDTTITASEATKTLSSEPEGGDLDIPYDSGAFPPVIDQMTGAVVGVSGSGGSYTLSVDFVEFLAGEEAAAAAKEHGDAAPDSGLYIVNDNPKLREYPIQADITVRVTTKPDGTVSQVGEVLALKDWASALNGSAKAAYTSGTYIVTITNGTVTALEQLYLP